MLGYEGSTETMERLAKETSKDSQKRELAVPVPVFIYHELYKSSKELESIPFRHRRYYLSVERFQEHLDFLDRNQIRGCSLEQYLTSTPECQKKSVVLTFDDGHISNYEWVWPMLKAKNMSATFFAVADWVGRADRISAQQFREMDADGMSIGSHGLTHSPLTKLSPSDLKTEMVASKEKLEQMLGKPIRHVAVPGGFINDAVVEQGKLAGYEHVCSSIPGHASAGFVLNRLSVTSIMSPKTFQDLASQRWFVLFKTLATYHAIQRFKGIIGVAGYERLCNRLMRRSPSSAQTPA